MKKIGGSFPYIALLDKPNGYLEQLTPENGELKYFMSGRCGIYYALLDHKLTADKLVAYVPVYTCETVLAPFHKAGYELIFYDFDENMNPRFDASVLDRIGIISICGYYGFSTYDRAFVAECSRRGITVIEDTTHSIFSSDGVDPHCDYIVGSFRKWIGVACGGFAIKTKGKFAAASLPPQEEHVTWRKEFFELKNGYAEKTPEEKAKIDQQSDALFWKSEMKLRQIFDAFRSDEESIHIMKYYPVEELQYKRRANYQYLLDHLNPSDKYRIVFQTLPEGTVPSHMTLYAADREAFRTAMAEAGISCTSYWPVGPLVDVTDHPEARYIYDHVCSIPCDQRYGDKEMQVICDVLNQL